mmetsp:Transcript_27514/g.40654  ORF Transcript_27514/g.40654 Transcript_27514/m.40654 type:complete len:302 (+) Transcript_27514:168-1073(+)|eukprot:CAMPEP_0194215838 /NCGR_PEP_ID=MMETSP0156-20130528/17920_1 /TAXON_ID=33649 /ORGANISM="Thalassionema nitzschioides, Strain L26-B" /LENGTH=301 /DNA_ID=CAMNT_0038944469 /DNA_START=68 /DNA_END=973 /DNA_ORIENTATION=+
MVSTARETKDENAFYSCCTVLITTSPVISDPDPRMLGQVLSSLNLVGLSKCRTILIMDHFTEGNPRKRRLCGRIPADRLAAYEARCTSIVQSVRDGLFGDGLKERLEVLQLKSWHGFALAVMRALEEVQTPTVCIVQHDLLFRRKIDLVPLFEVIQDKANGVNYIYFKRDAQKNYREKAKSLHNLELGPPINFGPTAATPLMRLPRYFDGIHIACTTWYQKKICEGNNFKPGQFIDQSLGKKMLDQAMEGPECMLVNGHNVSIGVYEICGEFGCWVWCGEEDPLIEHLNGRILRVRQDHQT